MNEKGRQTKLLAAIAIIAMVVCVFAVAMPSDAVDDEVTPVGQTATITEAGDFTTVLGADATYTKIVLGADIEADVTIPEGKVIELDLNGHTLTNVESHTITVNAGATLTITDSSDAKTGTVDNVTNGKAALMVNEGGVVVLNGGTFERSQEKGTYSDNQSNDNSWYTIYNSGNLTINDGTVVKNAGGFSSMIDNSGAGTIDDFTVAELIINGGTFDGGLNNIKNDGACELTINGGTFKNAAQAAVINYDKLNITGGNFDVASTGSAIVLHCATGQPVGTGMLEISGGVFSDGVPAIRMTVNEDSVGFGTITVTGGEFGGDLFYIPSEGKAIGTLNIDKNSVTITGMTAGADGITFNIGSIIISGTIDTTNPVSIDVDGNVSIQGELTGAGGLTVGVIEDGTANITLRDLVIPTGTTLSIVDGTEANPVTVTVSKSSTVQVDGTLYLGDYVNMDSKGSVTSSTGKGVINTTATSSVKFSGPMIGVAGDGNIINNNSSWSTITLNDGAEINAQTSIIASSTQEVVIAGDVTVVAGGVIDMSGKLTINEGATLTLEEGAKVIVNNTGIVTVNGDLVIEKGAASAETFIYNGSEMTVAGTVDIQGADAFICNGPVSVSGTMNIGEDASANFTAGLTIANGGNLNIDGVAKGKVTNNGTITIDTEVSGNDLEIQMGNGAVLDIVSLVGTVHVSDSEMPYTIQGVKYTIGADKANTMTFTDVSGVKISETLEIKTDKNGDRYAVNSTFISGAVGQAKDASGNALTTASIEISAGTVQVTDTLDLGKIAFSVDGTLKVSGTINAIENEITTDNKMVISGTGTIDVTGSIKTLNAITTTKVNAAHYTVREGTVEYNYYSTLGAAIAANADDIDILGALVIDSDVTIPAGTIVSATDKTDSILIKENATVTVAFTDGTSGKFDNGTVEIEVEGTLITENLRKSAVNENYVISDVATKNGDAAQFTNIYKALDDAQAGDKVTITKNGNITLNKDITVKSGVTLVIPEESGIIVDNGMTVTVDGTLENNGTYTINKAIEDDPETTGVNEAKEAGATVVNGLFKTVSSDQYTAQIAGAYFVYDDMDCIAPLSFVAENIGDLESDATIYGDVTVEDIILTYTGEDAFTLTVDASANFTAGTINLDNVTFNFNGRTNATIVIAEGTFVLKDVVGGNISDVVTYNADNTENHVATLSGAVKNATTVEDETTVYLDGSVSVSGAADIANATSVDFEVDVIIAEGATVGVSNTKFADASVFNAGKTDSNMVTVNGTMVIESTNVSFDSITVSGTVSVAADQKYTATVNDVLYAGVSVTVKDGKKIVTDLGTGAVIDGLVLGSSATAYASSNATVGVSIVDSQGMKSTVYYVDDAVYVTAYTKDSVDIDSIVANVTDAKFNGWVNADKEPATTYDSDGKVVTSEDIGAIGFTEVYADIDYNVYTVSIRTDGGIGSVAIDGNLMTNNGGNTFTMSGLTAGEHKVTYTLKNGFQGEAVLSSSDLAVSGNTFTLTGDFDTTYVLNLAGTEPADQTIVIDGGNNGGSDGLSLTDYLLIILVILIVIMAIIVASRMMRS